MTIRQELADHPVPQNLIDKATALIPTVEITPTDGVYLVGEYQVIIRDGYWSCDCQAHIRCKHELAALYVHARADEWNQILNPEPRKLRVVDDDPFEGVGIIQSDWNS